MTPAELIALLDIRPGGEAFCLCPVCFGARTRASSRGPIDCGTCKGKGTLTVAPIPRLTAAPKIDRCDERRAA